jgi:hypothetical protein
MVNGTAIKIPHIKPEKNLWRNPLFSVMITSLAQALSPMGDTLPISRIERNFMIWWNRIGSCLYSKDP